MMNGPIPIQFNEVHVRRFSKSFPSKYGRAVYTLIISLSLSACGQLLRPLDRLTNGNNGVETIYALDGVKMISDQITRGDDPRTYEQRTYTISSDSRLLLRFESLNNSYGRIQSVKPIRIRVFATTEEDKARAMSSLRACPIVQNWMMLATWNTSHPYRDGNWAPGGAIELDDCVSAEKLGSPAKSSGSPEAVVTSVNLNSNEVSPLNTDVAVTDPTYSACSEPGAICFDVRAWYTNYVIQRGLNFGIALISVDESIVQIHGDISGSKAPRIHWME